MVIDVVMPRSARRYIINLAVLFVQSRRHQDVSMADTASLVDELA